MLVTEPHCASASRTQKIERRDEGRRRGKVVISAAPSLQGERKKEGWLTDCQSKRGRNNITPSPLARSVPLCEVVDVANPTDTITLAWHGSATGSPALLHTESKCHQALTHSVQCISDGLSADFGATFSNESSLNIYKHYRVSFKRSCYANLGPYS